MGMNDNAPEFLSANQVSVDLLGGAAGYGVPGGLGYGQAQILGAHCESTLLGHQEGPWRRSELPSRLLLRSSGRCTRDGEYALVSGAAAYCRSLA